MAHIPPLHLCNNDLAKAFYNNDDVCIRVLIIACYKKNRRHKSVCGFKPKDVIWVCMERDTLSLGQIELQTLLYWN